MYSLQAARRRRLILALAMLVLLVTLWAAVLSTHALFARDFTKHELCLTSDHTAVVHGTPDRAIRFSGDFGGTAARLACVVAPPSPAPIPQLSRQEVYS